MSESDKSQTVITTTKIPVLYELPDDVVLSNIETASFEYAKWRRTVAKLCDNGDDEGDGEEMELCTVICGRRIKMIDDEVYSFIFFIFLTRPL